MLIYWPICCENGYIESDLGKPRRSGVQWPASVTPALEAEAGKSVQGQPGLNETL